MSSRVAALAFAVAAIVLTAAQDALPGRDWYHGWQYATMLGLAIALMAGYAWGASRGGDGVRGRRLALAMAGAIAVGTCGLLAGLIGPDTVTVVGSPGTVTPVPDLGVAAFFASADPATLTRGDASVMLRRRGAEPLVVGRRPLPYGLSVLFVQTRPAAYVVARDERGNHLTVTQPNNPSFLSPVLLFRQSQTLRDKTYPMDTIAIPAQHRVVRVLDFGETGTVLAASDDAGASKGIVIAPSGRPVTIAGLQLTITRGTYPVLLVAAAPQPYVSLVGLALFVGAGLWALSSRSNSRT